MDTNQMSEKSYGDWGNGYDQNPATMPAAFMARYMTKVYGWMFVGLLISAVTAFAVASSDAAIQFLYGNKLVLFGLFILQVAMVGALVIRIQKMSSFTAGLVFLVYAALLGVTLSSLLLYYTAGSLVTVFGITAGTFGIMSVVGYFTKQDLTSFGRIMGMGLIGVILASIVNFFLHSSTLYWIISYAGVAVFVGLIAYDTQKIKAYALQESEEARSKGAIIGALMLYLDFVNLFIFLLRLFGGRRN